MTKLAPVTCAPSFCLVSRAFDHSSQNLAQNRAGGSRWGQMTSAVCAEAEREHLMLADVDILKQDTKFT